MRIEIRADGVKVIKHRPIPERPFYSDWLKLLLERGAAHVINVKSRETGVISPTIVPHDRFTVVAGQRYIYSDGETGAIRIRCGRAVLGQLHEGTKGFGNSRNKRQIRFDRIRIGGFVQLPEEEQIDENTIERRWTVKPVYREGIGCALCKADYEEIAEQIREINEARESRAMVMTDIANDRVTGSKAELNEGRCIHMQSRWAPYCAICLRNRGIRRPQGVKTPSPLTPYIDIFPEKDEAAQDADSVE